MNPIYTTNTSFDYVIFMNDIFYCMEDVLRLILHEADMACGLDFIVRKGDKHLAGQP